MNRVPRWRIAAGIVILAGLVFYFGYGMKHSRLESHPAEAGR